MLDNMGLELVRVRSGRLSIRSDNTFAHGFNAATAFVFFPDTGGADAEVLVSSCGMKTEVVAAVGARRLGVGHSAIRGVAVGDGRPPFERAGKGTTGWSADCAEEPHVPGRRFTPSVSTSAPHSSQRSYLPNGALRRCRTPRQRLADVLAQVDPMTQAERSSVGTGDCLTQCRSLRQFGDAARCRLSSRQTRQRGRLRSDRPAQEPTKGSQPTHGRADPRHAG